MSKQKCQTPYCRKSAYVEPRGHVRLYCVGCSSKKWKAAHPYSYHFNALRNNAKRRGKEFTLTLDEYTEFAIANGLFDPNGKKFYNKTIDRRRNNEGYHAGNLQMLTRVENSRKRYVDYYANQFNDMDTEAQANYTAYHNRLAADIEDRRALEIAAQEAYDLAHPLPF